MRDIHDLCVQHGMPSLAQGMIELPPPEELRARLAETAAATDVHTYRARKGDPGYVSAIVGLLASQNEPATEDNVLAVQGVTGGVVAGLLLTQDRVRSEGRAARVALLEPFYTYHKSQVERITGAEPVYVACEPDLTPGVATLERLALSNAIDAVIICNPINPSGKTWSEAEIRRLLDLDLVLIFDECYSDMVFKPPFFSPVRLLNSVKHPDNLIICRGFSKCLGCQSWRVGYTVASPATTARLLILADPLYICTPITQLALAKFLSTQVDLYREHVARVNKMLQDNWADLKPAFEKRFGWRALEPEGTMYGCFWHDEETDMAAAGKCFEEAGVGICPGNMFFEPGKEGKFVRIHCGVSREKCAEVVRALAG